MDEKQFIVKLIQVFPNIYRAALDLSCFGMFLSHGMSVVVAKLKPEIKWNLLLLS